MSERQLSLMHEVRRKALHLISVIVPLAYALGVKRLVLGVALVAGCIVAVGVEFARARHEPTHARFHALVGTLLREHEHERWAGATWMLLSYAAATWLAPRAIAITAMWAVAVGDALAALVGRALGIGHVLGSKKTVSGSAACFAGVFGGALWIAHLSVSESVVGSLAAAIAEWPEDVVDDNVRIIAAVVGGILLWRIAFS
jgi:dolichol kinase